MFRGRSADAEFTARRLTDCFLAVRNVTIRELVVHPHPVTTEQLYDPDRMGKRVVFAGNFGIRG